VNTDTMSVSARLGSCSGFL
jgi:hypothetical protein